MKNTMKNTIAVFIFSMLACTSAALAWPWGNVGLNVNEPEAQLDVGGDAIVRSNLTVHGTVESEEWNFTNNFISLNKEEEYEYFGISGVDAAYGENQSLGWFSDGWGSGTPNRDFGEKQVIYSDPAGIIGAGTIERTPSYNMDEGVLFYSGYGDTNIATITVSTTPPGFIFNVNGVIWTNTP